MKELPEDIQQKIIAYIDGELPADEAAALEVYLVNTDPGISETVIGMMADRQSMSVLPKISAPQDLAGRVMEQLERASLLHNVEQDLNRARRRWWQTRPAIAAGVLLFVGGFSLIVMHTIYRSGGPGQLVNSPTNEESKIAARSSGEITPTSQSLAMATPHDEFASKSGAGGGGGRGSGMSAPMSKGVPHDDMNFDAGDEFDSARLNQAARIAAVSPDASLKAKGGAPAWLIIDTRKTIPEKLRELPQNIDKPVANGYLQAPTPQDALSSVSASPDDALDGPPVVIYIQARDKHDAALLEKRLTQYVNEDQSNAADQEAPAEQRAPAPNAAIAKSEAEHGNVLGRADINITNAGSGSVTIGGNNSFTGVSGVSDGKLAVQGGNSFTGSTAINAGSINVTSAANVTNTANNTLADAATLKGALTGSGVIANGSGANVIGGGTLDLNGNAGTPVAPLDLASKTDPTGDSNNVNQGNTNNDALVIDNGKRDAGRYSVSNNTGQKAGGFGGGVANGPAATSSNATNGVQVFNNAKQTANLHSGQPRGGINYDSNLGQYANTAGVSTQYRYARNGEQQSPQAQQDVQNAAEKFNDAAFVGQAGLPYRVYLSPEQINQVASEFRVRSINRGQVTYVIPESADLKDATKDFAQPSPTPGGALAPKWAGRQIAPVVVAPKPSAPAAPASAPALAEVKKYERKSVDQVVEKEQAKLKEQPGQQANQQGAGQQGGNMGFGAQAAEESIADRRSQQRLEVIIAIQPPAGPVASAPAGKANMGAEKSALEHNSNPASGH